MTENRKNVMLHIVRLVSLVTGATFVLLGIHRGEQMEVLGKAVRICLECIGLG